jgi:hypothetical protein
VRSAVRPRWATALVIVAVTLGFLAALAAWLGAFHAVSVLNHGYSAGFRDFFVGPRGWLREYCRSAAVADPCIVILLIGGTVLFARRRRWGRLVLTAGCAVVIALGVLRIGRADRPVGFGPGRWSGSLTGSGPSGPSGGERGERVAALDATIREAAGPVVLGDPDEDNKFVFTKS